jgi:hypothetical protein
MAFATLVTGESANPQLTKDLIKSSNKTITNTDYYDVQLTNLKVNKDYVVQLRWAYDDGTFGDYSTTYSLKTADETDPSTPSAPILVAGNGYFTVKWDGKNSSNQTMQDVARVNIYISGGSFNSSVESAFFTQEGSRNIPADKGSYAVTFKSVRFSGKISSSGASSSVDVTVDAGVALTSASGKNTIYRQSSQPTGGTYVDGDTWFDTSNNNKIYRYSGGSWTGFTLGNNALDSISASKLTAGTIDASVITVSNLDAGNITSGTLTGREINNGSGTFKVTAAGALTATNATITGAINATSGSFSGSISSSTITGGTIQTSSSSSANRVFIDSSTFKIQRNVASGQQAAGNLVEFDSGYGTLKFLSGAIEFDIYKGSGGSGTTLVESLNTTTYYKPLNYSDYSFITGSTNGYMKYVIEKTGPSYSADPGANQYNSVFYITPPAINGVYQNPGIVFSNNLFAYGNQKSSGSGTGEGKSKHSVYIDGRVGTYFEINSTGYGVKTLRNMYAVPTGAAFTTSGSIDDGEVLLYYTP